MDDNLKDRVDTLEQAFNEYEKAHKRSVRISLLIIVAGMAATTLCGYAFYLNIHDKRYIWAVLMVMCGWWDMYCVVKFVVSRELEKRDFRGLKIKHKMFVDNMRGVED